VDTQRDGQIAAEAGVSGPLDPDRVVFLIEDDEDVAPAPESTASEASVLRRRLADLVASHLVDPPPMGVRNEAATAALGASFAELPELVAVIDEAPGVVRLAGPDAVRVVRGRGGVAVRLHAPDWSLVVQVGGEALVVLDMMPAHAWRLYADLDWADDVRGMVDAVLVEVDRLVPTTYGAVGSGAARSSHVVSRH
jgi:hypothetical protein